MPSWFNIPAPLKKRLTRGLTEKVNSATYRMVVEDRRLFGDKRPDKTENRQDPEVTTKGD
jgi:hypothetical protein